MGPRSILCGNKMENWSFQFSVVVRGITYNKEFMQIDHDCFSDMIESVVPEISELFSCLETQRSIFI